MDKRITKGEETYQNIIHSAIIIISEQGIGGVSAAKVAEGAGISKSSVFHHFKSVDEILTAALNKIIDRMVNAVRSESSRSLADVLDSFERSIFHEESEFGKIERAFFAFYNESMFQNIYKEIFTEFLKDSILELENVFKRTGLNDQAAKNLSQLMIAILDGFCIQILITDKRNENYDSWVNFKKMILKYYSEG